MLAEVLDYWTIISDCMQGIWNLVKLFFTPPLNIFTGLAIISMIASRRRRYH